MIYQLICSLSKDFLIKGITKLGDTEMFPLSYATTTEVMFFLPSLYPAFTNSR